MTAMGAKPKGRSWPRAERLHCNYCRRGAELGCAHADPLIHGTSAYDPALGGRAGTGRSSTSSRPILPPTSQITATGWGATPISVMAGPGRPGLAMTIKGGR
jgi:hypothetical protein